MVINFVWDYIVCVPQFATKDSLCVVILLTLCCDITAYLFSEWLQDLATIIWWWLFCFISICCRMCYCHLPHSSSHICVTQRWCVLMQKPYRVGGTGISRSRSGLYVEKYYVCICLTHFIVHYLSLHSKCCSIPVTVVCRFRSWNVECCDVDERRGRGVCNWGKGQSRGRADGEEGECLEGISRCSCSWHDFGCSAKGLHSLAFLCHAGCFTTERFVCKYDKCCYNSVCLSIYHTDDLCQNGRYNRTSLLYGMAAPYSIFLIPNVAAKRGQDHPQFIC